jgi:hypothetical protein
MSKLNVELPDPVMLAFRKLVLDKYGSPKGGTGKAIEEAIRDYLKKNDVEIGEQGNFKALIPALEPIPA